MRFRQWAICEESDRVRWMVAPISCTIRLTSSPLAESICATSEIMRRGARRCQAATAGDCPGPGAPVLTWRLMARPASPAPPRPGEERPRADKTASDLPRAAVYDPQYVPAPL